MHPATQSAVLQDPDAAVTNDYLNMSPFTSRRAASEPEHDQEPPLMHFPHCRLSITPCDMFSAAGGGVGRLEQVALPGSLVRTLLARVGSLQPQLQFQPNPEDTATSTTTDSPSSARHRRTAQQPQPRTQQQQIRIRVEPHADDGAEWVYSRCLLVDFTGFCEDEAEALSAQGRLCCWASVVLHPVVEQAGGTTVTWDLGFVVHRVGVRDPESGWCECF